VKQALADALKDRGYDTLTPVQEAVTDPDLIGKDLLVSAQTGSGKTIGFGLAIAPMLLGEDEAFGRADTPLALVIAPTRELALQVKRELSWLFAKAGAVVTSCVGGMDMRDERRALQRGAHIVVATPGRLRDHIMRSSINLSNLQAVVLDEADEMLDLGFREDLEFILGESPETRQTLMFSATVPNSIAGLARSYQKDAVRVSTKSDTTQHADIEYRAMTVGERDAENAIINTLRFYEAPNAIVFCNTRAVVNRMTTRLSNRGFSVVALSGELSQAERTHALQAMRDGRARVCVATDVAARGIDLPNLDLVVHAELPTNHEILLHRSGRTGRAGRKGVSTLIVTPKTRRKAERILQSAKLKADWTPAPSAEDVTGRDEERMLQDPQWLEPVAESNQSTVTKLVENFSPDQLAAAYLRLFHTHHSAPEEISAVDDKPKPRVAFGPSVWFSIPGGRNDGAEPRRLLPMICKSGNLTKDDIGAIRIQQDTSYVEIRQASLAGFLSAVGPDLKVEDSVLTQLAAPPADIQSSRPAPSGKPSGKPKWEKRDDKPRAKYEGKRDEKRDEKPARKFDDKPAHKKPPRPEQSERPAQVAPKRETPKPAEKPKRDPRLADPSQRFERPSGAKKPRDGTTTKVDWNDDPTPKFKKPKPGAKTGKPKPRHKPEAAHTDGAVTTHKRPRPDAPKGGAPAKGKPSSKKNRARAAAKGKPGGNAPPKRRG